MVFINAVLDDSRFLSLSFMHEIKQSLLISLRGLKVIVDLHPLLVEPDFIYLERRYLVLEFN